MEKLGLTDVDPSVEPVGYGTVQPTDMVLKECKIAVFTTYPALFAWAFREDDPENDGKRVKLVLKMIQKELQKWYLIQKVCLVCRY